MHQCNYCCWYNERYGNCDCPYVMKKSACDKAKKRKERYEVVSDLSIKLADILIKELKGEKSSKRT